MSKKYMGSSLEDCLKAEGTFEEAQIQAVKEIVAWQPAEKGPGMRWQVPDLNTLLPLRCVFLEQSWQAYWDTRSQLAA